MKLLQTSKPAPVLPASASGTTRIARWKYDRTAAFCLMFDDSIPSDVVTVVPELRKRNMVGTFYVNPGGSGWQRDPNAWEKTLAGIPQVVYANHTMTHKGAHSTSELATELKQCNDVIYKLVPGRRPRLISFGRPGVPAENWTVTEAELAAALKENSLIERPPFGDHGAMIGAETPDEMIKMADTAIAKGDLGYIIFHGVGADWIITPIPIFTHFLDLLATRQKQLWLTDHISAYKYAAERDATTVRVLSADAKEIRLQLQTTLDPKLYDVPLTLLTRVPDHWRTCEAKQRLITTRDRPKSGLFRFDALPGDDPITIRPLKTG